MDKDTLKVLKKRLLALGVAGIMLGTTGCQSVIEEEGAPNRYAISSEYYDFDDYYRFGVRSGEAVKIYKTENVYILFDKESFEAREFIYDTTFLDYYGGQLYNLETEELLVYDNGISGGTQNENYYKFLLNNNYVVPLKNLSDYVEGENPQEFYSIDEIRELEPQIMKGLKILMSAKTLVKSK